MFGARDNKGVVLLNRLRLGFSHLNEHKFRHGFRDTLDPFCACRTNSIENSQHFILHCSIYSHARNLLFNKLQTLELNIYPLNIRTICTMFELSVSVIPFFLTA